MFELIDLRLRGKNIALGGLKLQNKIDTISESTRNYEGFSKRNNQKLSKVKDGISSTENHKKFKVSNILGKKKIFPMFDGNSFGLTLVKEFIVET